MTIAFKLPPVPAKLPHTQAEWEQFRAVMQIWANFLMSGDTATITTAKLASTTGSMTFQNGILISQTPAT